MSRLGDGLRTVEASPETLVKQAGWTAEIYLIDAIKYIDEQLGEGFAKKHPELIGHFMLTAAFDFHAASVQIASQKRARGAYKRSASHRSSAVW